MDCSNPVRDSTRVSLGSMQELTRLRRRQDLAHLESLVAGTRRVYIGSPGPRLVGGGTSSKELDSVMSRIDVSVPSSSDMDLSFLKGHAPVPVCGLMLDNIPIHPPGVNQEKGHVKVARLFGGVKRDKTLINRALEFYEPNEIVKALENEVYTRGTAAGFCNRMKTQMTRKCVQARSMESKAMKFGAKVSYENLRGRLKRLLPYDDKVLPDWNAPINEQLMSLKTSNISNAGAPYWKPKPEAFTEMVEVVLPLLHEAISAGKIQDLQTSQPELFLCEVKNKLDRYVVEKLEEKVRPYITLPWHIQVLFSCLSQPFSAALKIFTETGSNAYGFSNAHGGCAAAVKWARKAKDGKKPRFCVYGDDADIYLRKDGVLYRITPDFKQMDGSIDVETIRLTISYILQAFEKRFGGPNPFWSRVGEMWEEMATSPRFVVHGSGVYEKPQRDGLMTGVVGTTLFDTVKGLLAYDIWADAYMADRTLLQEGPARAFFARMGLEIKEGTWVPTPCNEEPIDGELWNELTFLGVSYVYSQGPNRVEPVPWLPDDKWLSYFLNPREDPVENRKRPPSDTMRLRTLFDRARGAIVTGAFTSPRVYGFLRTVIDQIPLVPIVMMVQAGGGKGEIPDLMSATPEDFEWPTSEGVPSYQWAQNLYFSADNQYENAEWVALAPEISAALNSFKANWKPLYPRVVQTGIEVDDPKRVRVLTHTVVGGDLPEVRDQPMDPISADGKVNMMKALKAEYRPRSEILNCTPTPRGVEKESRKTIPNSLEVFKTYFSQHAFKPRKRPCGDGWGMTYAEMEDLDRSFYEEAEEPAFAEYLAYKTLEDWYKEMEVAPGFGERKVPKTWEVEALPIPYLCNGLGKTPSQISALASKAGFVVLSSGVGYVYRYPPHSQDPLQESEVMSQVKPGKKEESTTLPTLSVTTAEMEEKRWTGEQFISGYRPPLIKETWCPLEERFLQLRNSHSKEKIAPRSFDEEYEEFIKEMEEPLPIMSEKAKAVAFQFQDRWVYALNNDGKMIYKTVVPQLPLADTTAYVRLDFPYSQCPGFKEVKIIALEKENGRNKYQVVYKFNEKICKPAKAPEKPKREEIVVEEPKAPPLGPLPRRKVYVRDECVRNTSEKEKLAEMRSRPERYIENQEILETFLGRVHCPDTGLPQYQDGLTPAHNQSIAMVWMNKVLSHYQLIFKIVVSVVPFGGGYTISRLYLRDAVSLGDWILWLEKKGENSMSNKKALVNEFLDFMGTLWEDGWIDREYVETVERKVAKNINDTTVTCGMAPACGTLMRGDQALFSFRRNEFKVIADLPSDIKVEDGRVGKGNVWVPLTQSPKKTVSKMIKSFSQLIPDLIVKYST